jgi:hypothetical protein
VGSGQGRKKKESFLLDIGAAATKLANPCAGLVAEKKAPEKVQGDCKQAKQVRLSVSES